MDPAYWSTMAQVIPVFFIVLALELHLIKEIRWKAVETAFRVLLSLLTLGLSYAEVRALQILGGERELFNDQNIAEGMVVSALGFLTGLGIFLFWRRTD